MYYSINIVDMCSLLGSRLFCCRFFRINISQSEKVSKISKTFHESGGAKIAFLLTAVPLSVTKMLTQFQFQKLHMSLIEQGGNRKITTIQVQAKLE